MQRHPGELAKGLANVEVTQRGDLEALHFVAARVVLCLLRCHLSHEMCEHCNQFDKLNHKYLSLECEVQSVPYEHFWDAWCVLLHLLNPPVYAFEAPFVGDIVH